MYGVRVEDPQLCMYDFDIVCGSSGTSDQYPKEFEIERKATIKDQGSVGACVACTFAEIGQYLYNMEMSEAWGYGTFRADSDKQPGLFVTRALDLWKKIGLVPLSDFGILKEMPEIRDLVKQFPDLVEKAKNYRIGGYAAINYADKSKKDLAIKKALTTEGIGLVGVSTSYFGESHCIMITGWNDNTNKYKFQNSWGIAYGSEGHDEMPKDKLDYVYAVFTEEFKLPFTDIEEDRWSRKDIEQMYFSGMIKGVTDTLFDPISPITREEAAVMINRLRKDIKEGFENLYKQINYINNN